MKDRFIEDLKTRVDIVEIVRKYAELKKSGKNYMCRSPFRNERTPSFCVSQEKQFWYDFGNSEGGDVISFIEKIENVSFREAVETLSDIAGVDLPKDFGKDAPKKEQKDDIYALHEKANEYFVEQLKKDPKANKYLLDRGLSQEVIDDWQLGYGGSENDGLTKFLLQLGFSQKKIQDSGVAFEREFGDKTMKDRFSERVLVPIREPRNGQIIAFSGRDISGKKNIAKYVNSPENPVYHKSSTLFGLDRARSVIRERDRAVLVEGNFDVVSSHMHGLDEVVATCGTSLTEDHLRILKRFTKNIVLAFDSDIAGKKATLRGVEMILKMDLDPYIVSFETVKDIDEALQKDPEEVKKLIEKAEPALQFLLDRFAKKLLDSSIKGEKKFLDHYFSFLTLSSRPVEVDFYMKKVSEKLNRPIDIVRDEFTAFQKKYKAQKPKFEEEKKEKKLSRQEQFVGFVSAFWNIIGPLAQSKPEKFLDLLSDENCKEILERKITEQPMDGEQSQQLLAWELKSGNSYSEQAGKDVIERDLKVFAKHLQDAKKKSERAAAAKKVREQLK